MHFCSSSQSKGASQSKKNGRHQCPCTHTGRNGTTALVIVAAEASRMGSLGNPPFYREARVGLPVAEQDTPEIRPAARSAGDSRPHLCVVLAMQYLEAPLISNEHVEGLGWRWVGWLARQEPPSDLGKACSLDTTIWGKCVDETGIHRLLVSTHLVALTLICFYVLQSNASKTLIISKI